MAAGAMRQAPSAASPFWFSGSLLDRITKAGSSGRPFLTPPSLLGSARNLTQKTHTHLSGKFKKLDWLLLQFLR